MSTSRDEAKTMTWREFRGRLLAEVWEDPMTAVYAGITALCIVAVFLALIVSPDAGCSVRITSTPTTSTTVEGHR